MKNIKFIVAGFLVTFWAGSICFADIVQESDETAETTFQSELLNGSPSISDVEESDVSSVPEPTTFGVITMALAIGGGLLVRRKND